MKLLNYFSKSENLAIVTAQTNLSYQELHDRVQAKMTAYQHLPQGSVVWQTVFNSVDTIVQLFAFWELGFCVFTVDPQTKADELQAVHKKLICNIKIDGTNGQVLENITVTSDLEPELAQTALVQLTSGSTGEPKLLKISLDALIDRSKVNGEHLALTKNDKSLCTMPLSHSHGLDCLTLPTLMNQGQILLFDPSTAFPFRILEWIKKYQVTFFSSLPQMYDLFNQIEITNPKDYQSLRYPFCGSAALSQVTAERFKAKFGLRLYQGYGLAEIDVICVNLNQNNAQAASIGQSLIGIEWKIESDGELLVKSPALFQGYFKNPELTNERLENGFLKTQDLVSVDEKGFLYISDRKNDFINVMGKKVYPREIEDHMQLFPEIKEGCVIAMPDTTRGQIPVLCLVPHGFVADKESVENDLIAELSLKLEDFKVPRKFIWLDQLPKSPIGKILRSQLVSAVALAAAAPKAEKNL